MIGRREFIAGLGSTAVWPVVVRAQQNTSALNPLTFEIIE